MTKVLKKIRLWAIIGCCAACAKEGLEELLPYERIQCTFDLTPTFAAELWVGGARMLPYQGYKGQGILLVRLSDDTFRAYAATCTHNIAAESARLTLSDDRLTAVCTHCHTVYYLQSGAYDAYHTCHLQEYRVTYNPATKHGVISN